MQPDRRPDRSREEEKNCAYADDKMTKCRKQEALASPPIKCADIEHADNAGKIGNQNPDKGPELTKKGKLFIGHRVQQGQQRKIEQGKQLFCCADFQRK